VKVSANMQMYLGIIFIFSSVCYLVHTADPLDLLRSTLPGEPGVDYPILSSIEDTGFDCEGKVFGGFYADTETDCQGYHVCLQDPTNGDRMYPISFLCPNGTIFNQELFTCEWWFNVDCTLATTFYSKNAGLFASPVGVSGGGDSCPALSPLPVSSCQGAVSSCWSPGQPDGDCPDFGLCCFDGCANTCGEAQAEVKEVPQPLSTTTTTEGYNYEPPKVTLPVRPREVTTTTTTTTTRRTTTTELELLYGAPRQGRNLSNRLNPRARSRNYILL